MGRCVGFGLAEWAQIGGKRCWVRFVESGVAWEGVAAGVYQKSMKSGIGEGCVGELVDVVDTSKVIAKGFGE